MTLTKNKMIAEKKCISLEKELKEVTIQYHEILNEYVDHLKGSRDSINVVKEGSSYLQKKVITGSKDLTSQYKKMTTEKTLLRTRV